MAPAGPHRRYLFELSPSRGAENAAGRNQADGNLANGQVLSVILSYNPANGTFQDLADSTYTTQVVAYNGEAATGVPGEVFSFIQSAS